MIGNLKLIRASRDVYRPIDYKKGGTLFPPDIAKDSKKQRNISCGAEVEEIELVCL